MADKFAARQCEKYTVVSLLPDVCLTPSSNGTPVPYPVDIDLSGSANVSPNVNFNDDGAFLYNQSDTVIVKNDEAGQGLGIVSGTVSEKAEAITSSESVIINGKQLVREGDLFFMNEKNTIGKLTTTESGGGDAKITEEGIEGKTVPNDFDKDGWPDDVPNPDADIGPPKPRRERTLSEKIENWSREAGQNNTEILDEELESIAEKIDQAKEAYAKGDYSAMSGAVIMAVADAFDPLKKVKMAGKMARGGGKGKKKKKEELKCGEGGTYQKLKNKLAQVVGMERDHVPSGGALKQRAFELNKRKELSDTQLRKIENIGETLAIPAGIHASHSLTYKWLNNEEQIAKDAGNLKKAATRDLRAVKKGLSKECKQEYEKYAKKIRKIDNAEYDRRLLEVLNAE